MEITNNIAIMQPKENRMISKKKRSLKHVDCFAGVGGICTGFRAAGIKTVLAIEKVQSCVETYLRNHPEVPVLHEDIRKVSEADIKKYIKGPIDILTSGMPCETFSTAGSKSRSFYDSRQYLFEEAIRIAKITKAKLILFENVPAITTKKTKLNGSRLIIHEIFDSLKKAGYAQYIDIKLNAVDFGVPQLRERYFVIATNDPGIRLSLPKPHKNERLNVKDAFFDLPIVEANEESKSSVFLERLTKYTQLMKDSSFWNMGNGSTKLTYHVAPKHRPGTLKRFKLINQGEGLKDLFNKLPDDKVKKLQDQKILPKKWYIQRNRRLVENRPSVTVTSHCLDELLHPTIDRSITVREAARLQSFPDCYDFIGGPFICPHMYETQDKYEQIGDAVPPLLAYAWGDVVKKIMGV